MSKREAVSGWRLAVSKRARSYGFGNQQIPTGPERCGRNIRHGRGSSQPLTANR
jgi:hypothetical protein